MKTRSIILHEVELRPLKNGALTHIYRPVKRDTIAPVVQPYHSYNEEDFTSVATNGASSEISSPFGRFGDRLWVREWFWPAFKMTPTNNGCVYRVDYMKPCHGLDPGVYFQDSWTRPSLMHRKESRFLLEIRGVRVQKLHSITTATILRQEIAPSREDFIRFWNKTNHRRDRWELNPWIWVYRVAKI